MFDGERSVTGGATVADRRAAVIAGVRGGASRTSGRHGRSSNSTDATVLPGLIDTHVHLVADSGRRALDRSRATPTTRWTR